VEEGEMSGYGGEASDGDGGVEEVDGVGLGWEWCGERGLFWI
jgi:hypothetical protein